jgi:drug/metabolite transporter (DMT)-like permease
LKQSRRAGSIAPRAAGADPARSAPAARAFGPAEAGLLLALGGMWGFSFLFIEIALRGLGPIWIVAGRTGIGAVFLIGVLHLRGKRLPTSLRVWKHLLMLGILANAIPWVGASWAQQWLPSGLVALLMAAVPASTLVVSVAAGLERFTLPRITGLALALSGVALTVAAESADPGRAVAIAVVVGATVMYAIGAVYANRLVSGLESPLTIAAGQVLMAFLVSLPAALLLDSAPRLERITPEVAGAVLALGMIGTGAAFLLFYTLIERVGATNTTLVSYLIPLVAVIAGAVVLGERIGAAAMAGGGLIVAGVWLAQKGTRGGRSASPASPAGSA